MVEGQVDFTYLRHFFWARALVPFILLCSLGSGGHRAWAADPVADPEFTPAAGFYDAPFNLVISTSTPGASIYYTTDGSKPSKTNGKLYTGSFRVEGTSRKAVVTLRAAAFRDGYLPSNATSSTYIFLAQVPFQPADPAGFPTSWGSAPAVDYGMDPEIVNHPAYAPKLRDALLQIPSVSLVCNLNDLFGTSGIYSNPLKEGDDWERPASLEILYPDGRKGFQINCGVRIMGNLSRDPLRNPKHTFRVKFTADYGPTKLRFPLFPDSHVASFDEVVLRVEMGNSWVHWQAFERPMSQYCRDQWVRECQLAMGHLSAHGFHVHLYLNGLYWGIYNLMERPSSPFISSYGGGEREDYDVLNSGEALEGDRVAWDAMIKMAEAGLSTAKQYQAIQSYLDVVNFADYVLLNMFAGAKDWPGNNWYAARRREAGAQFRFFSWDAERVLESATTNKTNIYEPDTPGILFLKLKENAEFRLLFADRVQKHLFAGGALTPEASLARWKAEADAIQLAVIAESARWGDYRRDVHPFETGPYELYTRDDHWIPEYNRLVTDMFPRRTSIVLGQLRQAGLYPEVEAPILSQSGGKIQSGFQLEIRRPTGTSGTIYYTLDGSDPRVYGSGAVSGSAKTYSGALTLKNFTRVKARILSGGSWSALTEGVFSLLTEAKDIQITEVMYNPRGGKEYEFFEMRNGGASVVDLSGMYVEGGISFVFPESTFLEPGAFLVLVDDPSHFRQLYPEVPVGGVYSGSLDNAGEKVEFRGRDGTLLAWVDYDNERYWPLGPDGFGYSLVGVDPSRRGDDPEGWRASARVNGSPFAEDPSPVHGGVLINEILTDASQPLEDAIELFNAGDSSMSIGGWYLSDNRLDESSLKKFRIPTGTVLPPGGHVVFYEYQFNSRPGSWPSFSLSGGGESVYLSSADSSGKLTGHIVGHDFEGAESGVSLGRYVTTAGPDFTALEQRTFGVDAPATLEEFRSGEGLANARPRIGPVVIHEIMYHPPESGDLFIEIYNVTDADVPLYDSASRRGWRISGIKSADETDDFEFASGAVVPAGGYLVVAGISPAEFRARHSVPAAAAVVGPFGGGLDNGGERIRLFKPKPGSDAEIVVDQVRYDDELPWPTAPDGTGPSLERMDALDYGNEPANWDASKVTGGTPGAENTVKGVAKNKIPVATFHVDPPLGPAPLDLRLDASESFDPDGSLVSFQWSFGDGNQANGITVTHTYEQPGEYIVVLEVMDDQGAGAEASAIVLVNENSPEGRRFEIPFADLLRYVSTALGQMPPSDPALRVPVLAGNAALLGGTSKCAVKGLARVVSTDQVLVLFGPMDVLGDSAQTVVSVPAGVFLAVDDDQRFLKGTYTYSDRGKLYLYPENGCTRSYMAALVEGSAQIAEQDMELRRIVLAGGAKAGRTGDILKLKVKVSFVIPAEVNGRQILRGGSWGLGGFGNLLRP